MNMRFENMRDGEAGFARHVHINIDICSGVEDCSHSFVIIADKIGKLGDPFGLDGFKYKRHREELTRSGNVIQQDRQTSIRGAQATSLQSSATCRRHREYFKDVYAWNVRTAFRQAAEKNRLAACAPRKEISTPLLEWARDD